MKRVKRKSSFFILSLFLLLSVVPGSSHAQVTIGSNVPPNSGALLDLKETNSQGANSQRGLLLPRVNLVTARTLTPQGGTYTDEDIHVGLWVYNLYNSMGFLTWKSGDGVCPGPYAWSGTRWERLLEACSCEYTITGWQDSREYTLLCKEFTDVKITDAVSTCKTIKDKGKTYHLMTYEEYEQIWSEPISVAGTPSADYSFESGVNYFIHKKSDTPFPSGWITIGTESNDGIDKVREVLSFDRTKYHTSPAAYFPGGLPIGGVLDTKATVRCIQD